MLKEAMQYITGLKAEAMEPKVVEIAGKTYCDKDLTRYDREPMADQIEATTLTAMIDYIKSCSKELRETMIIHVVSPTTVKLYSGLTGERKREYLFKSSAIVPKFSFDNWYDQERFIIELQADFEVMPDLEAILKVAGNVEANQSRCAGAESGHTGSVPYIPGSEAAAK